MSSTCSRVAHNAVQSRAPARDAGSIFVERGPNTSPFAKVAKWVGGVALIVSWSHARNVANLLLARGFVAVAEIAVRLAARREPRSPPLAAAHRERTARTAGGIAAIAIASGRGSASAGLMPQSAPSAAFRDPRTLWFHGARGHHRRVVDRACPVLQARRADLTSDLRRARARERFHRSGARVALLVIQGAMSSSSDRRRSFRRSLTKVQSIRLATTSIRSRW